jgi:hypothetical protein
MDRKDKKIRIPPRKVGVDIVEGIKNRKFSYRDVRYKRDGWADARKYRPADFDLMFLMFKDKGCLPGWSVGKKWDGLEIDPDDKVLYWKRKPE